MTLAARLVAAAVGAVLAFAGASKATGFVAWRENVRGHGLPGVVAIVVPAAELVLGSCLVVLPLSGPVIGASVLLLAGFGVYLAMLVARGSPTGCACFGSRSSAPPRWADVGRNALMVAALCAAGFLR